MSIESLLKQDAVKSFGDLDIAPLGNAVDRLLKKQRQIAEATEILKQMGAEERAISEGEIPALMENLGFETITMQDGRKVSVKDSIQCGIKVADKPSAFAWLAENNHGDLIKAAVSAKFSRGEKAEAAAAVNALKEMGISASLTESVHPGTLKAWARVELEQGHSLPPLFNIHIVKQTTVK
jgi:hypothetical protein